MGWSGAGPAGAVSLGHVQAQLRRPSSHAALLRGYGSRVIPSSRLGQRVLSGKEMEAARKKAHAPEGAAGQARLECASLCDSSWQPASLLLHLAAACLLRRLCKSAMRSCVAWLCKRWCTVSATVPLWVWAVMRCALLVWTVAKHTAITGNKAKRRSLLNRARLSWGQVACM